MPLTLGQPARFHRGGVRPSDSRDRHSKWHPVAVTPFARPATPLVLPKLKVSEVGLFEEQTAPLIFDGRVKNFLQGRVGLFCHLHETLVGNGTDADRSWHTNLYTSMSTIVPNASSAPCPVRFPSPHRL